MKKSLLNDLVVMGLVCGSLTFAGRAWADTEVKPTGSNNTVVVTASGWTLNGVEKSGGSPYNPVCGGYSEGADLVMNNSVTVNGGSIGFMYGGYSLSVAATGNSVTVNGGSIAYMYGGYSKYNTATGNSVTVNDGSIGIICGGSAETDVEVTNNSVTVNGGSIGSLYGGYASSGVADDNIVVINDAKAAGICGGCTDNGGSANNNSVTLNNAKIADGYKIYGGLSLSSSSSTANNNVVTINGGEFISNTNGGKIFGGSSQSGNANNNMVVIGGDATFSGTVKVYGGSSGSSGNSTGNTVQISVANTGVDLSKVNVIGGYSESGSVSNNTLIVSTNNITVAGVSGFDTYAFYVPTPTAFETLLTVGDGTSNFLDLAGSTVYVSPVINDGKVNRPSSILMMYVTVTGTDPILKYDLAPGNTIEGGSLTISDNKLTYSRTNATVTQWTSVQPSALTGNIVELVANESGKTKATIYETTQTYVTSSSATTGTWQNVYGGYSSLQGAYVADNKVTIASGDGIGSSTAIYGGYAPNGTVENNTLEVKTTGVTVGSVNEFTNYTFDLTNTTGLNNGDTVLTLSAAGDDFSGDIVTVKVADGTLGGEESITLIKDYFAADLSALASFVAYVDGEEITGEDLEQAFTVANNSLIFTMPNSVTLAEMNINALAGVQQGMLSMQNQTAEAVAGHLSLANKAAGKQEKEVWASYIHNKNKVEGLKSGGAKGSAEANYEAQLNGVTVGADLYTSEKAVAGVALSYADGETNGYSAGASINNDTKYYGVTLYDRVTNGKSAVLLDMSYMHGKNEISAAEKKNWTGDADLNSFTAGVRYEREVTLKGSKLVPFAGVRYIYLQNKDFTNSKGLNYSTDNQNLFQPQLGLAWSGEYSMSKSSWTAKPQAEVGYLWALGDREATTELMGKKALPSVNYDVTDKNSYYCKLGVEFQKQNLGVGVDYRYLKGDNVRGNKWNVNLTWSF